MGARQTVLIVVGLVPSGAVAVLRFHDHGFVDWTSELPPVRKGYVSIIGISNDLVTSALQLSPFRKTTDGKRTADGSNEISSDLVPAAGQLSLTSKKNQAEHLSNISSVLLNVPSNHCSADGGARIVSFMCLLQWLPESIHLPATMVAVLLFCFMWVGMVKLESELERRNKTIQNGSGGHVNSGQRSTNTRGRTMRDTTDSFASPGEQGLLDRKTSLQKLRFAALSTGLIMVVIMIIGRAVGSLSLWGEGIHLLGHSVGYFSLFFATIACQWDSDGRFTFGFRRIEVLGVLAAVVLQYHEAANVAYEAYERFWNPKPLNEDAGMHIIILSCLSMAVNFGLAILVSSSGKCCGHDRGGSAAGRDWIHSMCDLSQHLLVFVTGVVLWLWPRFYIIDSICVLFSLILLFARTLPRAWEILSVLLEVAPKNLNSMQLRQDLLDIKGVRHVRNLHVWCITPGQAAAIAHIDVKDEPMDVLKQTEHLLKHKYGIHHFTFQVSDDEPL